MRAAGVHPLHIAVKREYTDCIGYLMSRELPIERVKEELGWAVQFDLSQSVFCLLVRPLSRARCTALASPPTAARRAHRRRAAAPSQESGAPHGLRVLCPWTTSSRRQQNSKDHSLPLGYYWVVRGWRASMVKVATLVGPYLASMGSSGCI